MCYISDKNTLCDQIWIGDGKPCLDYFINNYDIDIVSNKPKGGLWTSSLLEDYEECSEWIRFYKNSDLEKYNNPSIYLLKPENNLNIIEINNKNDLEELYEDYGDTMMLIEDEVEFINYNQIKKDGFDCVRLSFKGCNNLKELYFDRNIYSTWNCESTVWLSFKFKEIIKYDKL